MYKSKSSTLKENIIENIITALVAISIWALCLVVVPLCVWSGKAADNGNMAAPYVKVYSGFDYDIVYDKDTMVMYSISTATDSRGVATVMLNADGTPKLWDGETSETN